MSEQPRQENFEELLFKGPEKKPEETLPISEKPFDCQLCQDVGYCARCKRGQEWLENQPKTDFFPKKKKKKR